MLIYSRMRADSTAKQSNKYRHNFPCYQTTPRSTFKNDYILCCLLLSEQFLYCSIIILLNMEQGEPISVQAMYNCTRQKHDFNVIRKYQSVQKIPLVRTAITKKGHYLDDAIKTSFSPGPANKSNTQYNWSTRLAMECKTSERSTYLDSIQKIQKKNNFPSPNKYYPKLVWPLKTRAVKHQYEKITFANNCEYESLQTPGPGNYCITTRISMPKRQGKVKQNHPRQTQRKMAPEPASYSPCSVDINTFARMQKQIKLFPKKDKNALKSVKSSKQNMMPGPGAYSTINYWMGKVPLKKDQRNLFRLLAKGPSSTVYNG